MDKIFIVSGGQTGVDRAAWDYATSAGLKFGGSVPNGFKAEDGVIPDVYRAGDLTEIGDGYLERTKANVRNSDATLVLVASDRLTPGTRSTIRFLKDANKDFLVVDIRDEGSAPKARSWVRSVSGMLFDGMPFRLNVAGPRESKCPGVHDRALGFLKAALG